MLQIKPKNLFGKPCYHLVINVITLLPFKNSFHMVFTIKSTILRNVNYIKSSITNVAWLDKVLDHFLTSRFSPSIDRLFMRTSKFCLCLKKYTCCWSVCCCDGRGSCRCLCCRYFCSGCCSRNLRCACLWLSYVEVIKIVGD